MNTFVESVFYLLIKPCSTYSSNFVLLTLPPFGISKKKNFPLSKYYHLKVERKTSPFLGRDIVLANPSSQDC